MPTFTVFKGSNSGKPVQGTTTKPDQLEGDQVLLRITASGVCGTDLHYKSQDMVLGHEGVGIIEQIGPQVKRLKKGDRVGWGYETDSCGLCIQCLSADETHCPSRQLYGDAATRDQGSFATHAIWKEAFLHIIPQGIADEHAAPLQCAGATVFSALQGIEAGSTVGVLGVGGLGHLAIQFAVKMGCRVVALSNSDRKREQAAQLGAFRFINMEQFVLQEVDRGILDRLVVTAFAQPDWNNIFPLMGTGSTVIPLSISNDSLNVPYMPLVLSGIAIKGSLIASRKIHRQMLAFAALHDIRPTVEIFPMTAEGVQNALNKLENGNMNYRAVLVPPK